MVFLVVDRRGAVGRKMWSICLVTFINMTRVIKTLVYREVL